MLESLLETFPTEVMIWLFPVIFMFHALEEIITIEIFMKSFKNKVPKPFLVNLILSIKIKFSPKSSQHSVFITWILLFITFTTVLAARQLSTGTVLLLFLAIFNLFFLQAFSHIGQTIIFRGYTPGVLTAIFFVIPFSLLTYFRLFALDFIDGQLLIKSIPFSLIMAPIFLLGHLLGRKFID